MGDQVTENLREMILTGELPAGAQITHDQVAEMLQVSTMPVREALLKLTHEGLIEGGVKARSFQVGVMTIDDVRDIYWFRSQLTGELAARAATRLDGEQIERLKAAHQDWLAAAQASNMVRPEDANDDFHRIINEAAGAPKLLHFLRHTLRLIPNHYYAMLPGQIQAGTQAHLNILNAVVARDAVAARAAAEEHVLYSAEQVIKNFDEKGYWTGGGESQATASRARTP